MTPAAVKRFLQDGRASLNLMKPREKRTTTQPGLGQLPGDPRSTAVRERVADAELSESARVRRATSEAPESGPPISAPPISGAPPSARQTRAIESVPAGTQEARKPRDTKPVDTKTLAEPDRIESTPTGGRRDPRAATIREAAPDSREIARPPPRHLESPRRPTVETPRSLDVESSRSGGRPLRPIEGRPVDGSRPVSRPAEACAPQSESSGSRPADGRPIGGPRPSRAPQSKPVSSKPPGGRSLSHRPPASNRPVGRPAEITAPRTPSRPGGPSRRSIREDDVGSAIGGVADAIGAAGRQVPKIVRTKKEIAEAPIDHRAGFLLAHIDGVTSVQGLVDVAAMPENEVHEILERLRRLGIVVLR